MIFDPRRPPSDTRFAVWKVTSFAGVILGVASGCSSASSSSEALPPGQLDADGPTAVRPPPTDARKPPPPPPEDMGLLPGCPSSRDGTTVEPTGAADVRARLPGIYRSCAGGAGIELRVDPDDESRLLWYALDLRFVRIQGSTATTGYIDVSECEGTSCTIEWHSDGLDQQVAPIRTMTIWSGPTALLIENGTGDGASWSEWVRVAK